MTRSKIIAIAIAAASLAAGAAAVAHDTRKPESQGAHKEGMGHEGKKHARNMEHMAGKHERMGEMHKRMGEMHKGMKQHGTDAGKQDSKKPDAEEHKH